jgi:hypothetical protein
MPEKPHRNQSNPNFSPSSASRAGDQVSIFIPKKLELNKPELVPKIALEAKFDDFVAGSIGGLCMDSKRL